MPEPTRPDADAIVGALRRLEARVAQLEDQMKMRKPRLIPLPELTPSQQKTLVLLAIIIIFGVGSERRRSFR